jgi:hypothetical protein
VEWNKKRRESRTIEVRGVRAEDIGFPFAQQAARIRRQVKGREDELVCLITSCPASELNPRQWLTANRLGWGIESGLHQRLDISLRDDDCRVRTPRSMWVLGMFRRLANSLFMHWRSLQRRPQHKTTTDFHAYMDEENLRRALRFVKSKRPSLKPSS